jgi:predicted ATP-dependent endonuclease of OLD family
MRIKTLRIQNFRSIRDSGTIEFEKDITSFIGKNESGKTNILKCIELFNTDKKFDLTKDLCRYNQKMKREINKDKIKTSDIEIIRINFDIEEKDKDTTLDTFGEKVKLKEIAIYKNLDNSYGFEIPQLKEKLDSLGAHIHDTLFLARNKIGEFNEKVQSNTIFKDLNQDLVKQFKTQTSQFSKGEWKIEGVDKQFSQFIDFTSQFKDLINSNKELEELSNVVTQLFEKLIKLLDGKNSLSSTTEAIKNLIPPIVYINRFDDRIEDEMPANNLITTPDKYKTLINLCKLVGFDYESLATMENQERIEHQDECNTKIKGLVTDEWKHEEIEVAINVQKEDIIINVKDPTHKYSRPSERSDGFRWYFSFYINLNAETKDKLKDAIILIDEPSLYLHATGQDDVYRTLKKLSNDNQIIFTTHSPFLIKQEDITKIRLVERLEKNVGTKIKKRFYESKNTDSLAPIRAAIGLSLGDMMFFSRNNVIVEGINDFYFLRGTSNYLKNNDKDGFIDNLAVVPVGGVDKIPIFTPFVENEKFNYIVVLDSDKKGKAVYENMKEYLEDSKKLISIKQFVKTEKKQIDIEDLFSLDFYINNVNESYEDLFKENGIQNIKKEDLKNINGNKITKIFGEEFKKKKYSFKSIKFSKTRVAKHIFKKLSNEKTNKFEKEVKNMASLLLKINASFNPQSP